MKQFVTIASLLFATAFVVPPEVEAQRRQGTMQVQRHRPRRWRRPRVPRRPRSVPELDGRAAPGAIFLLVAGGLVMHARRRRITE